MVRLVPMTEEDLQVHLLSAIPEYAQEHVAAGDWASEEALERSERDFKSLLPDGVASPGQYLYAILATGEDGEERKVGILWFAIDPKRLRPFAWVYDFLVYPQDRRHGYGRAAFLAMEDEVRVLGVSRIELHVFGHNHAARALYESLGYGFTHYSMAKMLA